MPAQPFPERLNVGMFLCKEVNEERVKTVINRLLDSPRVSNILIRPHPKNLWVGLDAWVTSRSEPRLSLSTNGTLSQDLEAMDIVLAGNSSVLVDAVTAGRPGGYVSGIDYGSDDLHALVARGLIYPIGDDLCFDPDAMLRFYQRPDWLGVLRLFANVDEDEASVTEQVVTICRELADSRKTDVPEPAINV
jgi:hypothetical protein